jgi:hypothetical protein
LGGSWSVDAAPSEAGDRGPAADPARAGRSNPHPGATPMTLAAGSSRRTSPRRPHGLIHYPATMRADSGASAGPSSRRRMAPITSPAPMRRRCRRCVANRIMGYMRRMGDRGGWCGRAVGWPVHTRGVMVSPASGPAPRTHRRRPWLARDPVCCSCHLCQVGHAWAVIRGEDRRSGLGGRTDTVAAKDELAGRGRIPPMVGGGIRPVGPPAGSRRPGRPIRGIGVRHHGVLPPMDVRGRRRALPIAPIAISAPMIRSDPLSANHAEHGGPIDRAPPVD